MEVKIINFLHLGHSSYSIHIPLYLVSLTSPSLQMHFWTHDLIQLIGFGSSHVGSQVAQNVKSSYSPQSGIVISVILVTSVVVVVTTLK